MQNWLTLAGLTTLIAAGSASAEQPQYQAFFGKTVSYTTRWCEKDDAECKRTPLARQRFRFLPNGTLIEAYMCGDAVERRHPFGNAYNFSKTDSGGFKASTTMILGGTASTIDIQLNTLLRFQTGGSSIDFDRFALTWVNPSKCLITGSREVVDMPYNERRQLILISDDCRIE